MCSLFILSSGRGGSWVDQGMEIGSSNWVQLNQVRCGEVCRLEMEEMFVGRETWGERDRERRGERDIEGDMREI